MDPEELVRRHPTLFHMASAGSWPAIREHGLLSTSALLDLFDADADTREAVLRRRAASVTLESPELGVAVIRDQRPLRLKSLEQSLVDMTVEEWLGQLNSKVFFWLDERRLEGLLAAKEYRGATHDVITLDTSRLIEREGETVRLSPINSGSTLYVPSPRGRDTFKTIAEYPFEERRRLRGREAIAELTVEDSVLDVEEVALKVERRAGDGSPPELLWSR
jgi:hypothetical protein